MDVYELNKVELLRDVDIAAYERSAERYAAVLALHEGNFFRYRIRPSEFEAWSKTWARMV